MDERPQHRREGRGRRGQNNDRGDGRRHPYDDNRGRPPNRNRPPRNDGNEDGGYQDDRRFGRGEAERGRGGQGRGGRPRRDGDRAEPRYREERPDNEQNEGNRGARRDVDARPRHEEQRPRQDRPRDDLHRNEARRDERPRVEAARGRNVRRGEDDDDEPEHRNINDQRRIGFRKLHELRDREPGELLNYITIQKSGFPDALKDDNLHNKPDCMGEILAVITTALKCEENPAATVLLLNHVRQSPFLERGLLSYFSRMPMETQPARLRGFKQPIKDTLQLLKALLTRFPANYLVFSPVIATVEYVIRALREVSTIIDVEIETFQKEVSEMRDHVEKDVRDRVQRVENPERPQIQPVGPPPNDFREMSIFPDVQFDIHSKDKPYLRANIKEGGFDDIQHYLDIQFRLLREDFIQPLRNGIKDYLQFQSEAGGNRRLNDIRVYYDVSVLNAVCTHTGIQYRVHFDVSRLKNLKWKYSKRLIYGSLVCLSNDDFNTLYIGTVADRKPENLEEGYLQVRFETNHDAVRRIRPDERFLMVETSAYFEAYRYVLDALQNMDEADVPFQENIIHCRLDVNVPRYLLTPEEPCYNIQHLSVEFKENRLTNNENNSDASDDEDGMFDPTLASVPILKPREWPSAETLGLDMSQLRAIQAALTKELTIIQGPPGTGKTYIGLKVVQSLLNNKRFWNVPNHNSPILIVCYTNHALDQFLEGIYKFLKTGIVRVGGRSKSKLMEKFLLTELRRKVRENRDVPRAIFSARIDARQEMERWQVEIERFAAIIESTERGLIHEEVLQEFISEEHYIALMDGAFMEGNDPGIFANKSSQRTPSCLPSWLGLGDLLYVDEPEEAGGNAEPDNAMEEGNEQPEEPQEVIEVEDEVGAIEADRMVDEEDEAALRRHQQEERRRRNVDQANADLAVNLDDVLEANPPGWQQQRVGKKKRRQRLQKRLRNTSTMSEDEVNNVQDIWRLNLNDRWKLYRHWVNKYKRDLKESALECETNFQVAADRIKELIEEEDKVIMQNMKVIGMTTTGAARYKNILRHIQPKLVIVEEAAEVLEAHIITTLSSGCEHLILIGDHKQLRPSPNVHKLGEDYNLKYSLFERLVINDLPYETLKKQHRMRPEIADLVRIIYPHLEDDETVLRYDNIRGVSTNVFLIDHQEDEYINEELKSVSNDHEAKFLVKLCRYLTLQGYSPEEITILTPYTGQMFRLRELMPKQQFEGVRVCPIDNYQGEENEIILLSLVRSNTFGKIGFVKDENRACVALSRAKKGLYVVGNFTHLGRHSELWSRIAQQARNNKPKLIGEYLTLSCQNHPDAAQIKVQYSNDFDQAPEGGCLRPCGFRLKCGHACDRVCHSYDRNHELYKCTKPCQKVLCAYNHVCQKRCQDNCGPCTQLMERNLPCGHKQLVPCNVPVMDFRCQENCNHRLACGHYCKNPCGEDHTRQCSVLVVKKLDCGHPVRMLCHRSVNEVSCNVPCGKMLDCDHKCSGTCGTCMQGRIHAPCKSECGRALVCGHACNEPCTKDCPPCSAKCENRCTHSRCPRNCGISCEPCREFCLWRCPHYKCTKLCYQPCDRPRCNESCNKRLRCGHPCIGLCGELCPMQCRICNREEVTEIFFGTEDEEDARFVQLEDCKHFLEVTGLDHWMDMARDNTIQSLSIQLKQCPKCKTPIRRNQRYGTIINETLEDIEMVKLRILGNSTENKRKQVGLEKEFKRLNIETHYRDRLKDPILSQEELSCIENVKNFLEHIQKWKDAVNKVILGSTTNDILRRKLEALKKDMKVLLTWVLQSGRIRFAEQELRECSMEITRFDLLATFYQIENRMKNTTNPRLTADIIEGFNSCLKQLSCGTPLTKELENKARHSKQEVEQCLTGLGISEEERIQIVNAMDWGQWNKKGHWFKCRNGHYYAIGDCGGAMTESKCPECGATIGGGAHTLRGDNQFAPEVDGATAPAWPGMGQNR